MQRNKPNSEGGVTELVRSLPPTVRQKMDMFGGTTVLDDPILDHHYSNIKKGKTRKNKDGYLNTVVTIQVEDKSLNDGKPTLIPTVYDGKIVSEKEAVKRAIDSGKKWTSADTHAELREYDIMLHKRMSGDLAFSKGGTVPMQQMEMFDLGGLKDEGGTKDPVSGNDVPTGSLKEEVRDDIDAKLSPGEFVFPADVVRFIGLQKLMQIRDKAKAGLQRMEDMGQMGNSDEAILDEDVPFEPSDLIIVGGTMTDEKDDDKKMNVGGVVESTNEALFQKRYFDPDNPSDTRLIAVFNDVPVTPIPQGFIEDTPENRQNAEQRKTEESTSAMLQKMAKGGMPVKLQTGGDLSDFANVPASGRFEQLVGQPQFGYEVKEFRNAQGNQLFIPFFRGVPSYQPPPGYTEVTPEQQQEAGAQPEKPEETSTLKQDRSSMDPDVSGKGFNEMSPLEQAQYGQSISTGFGKVASDIVGTAMTLGEMMLGPPVGAKLGAKALGIELPDFSFGKKADDDKAKAMAEMMKNDPIGFAQEMQAYDAQLDTAITDAEKAIGALYGVDVARDTVSRAIGVSKSQVIAHAAAVGAGEAPPGSTANAIGGYSTPDFSTNQDNEVIGKDAKEQMDKAEKLGISISNQMRDDLSLGKTNPTLGDLISNKEKADKEKSIADVLSGLDTPEAQAATAEAVSQQQQSDQAGGVAGQDDAPDAPDPETAAAEEGDFGGVEGNVGGFIPKKKKQKKKRSGLASR